MCIFTKAITRQPGADFANGITTSNLGKPNLPLAIKQHDKYVSALKDLKLEVETLAPLLGMPDACFVEDTAIVTEEIAVITRPGASSRIGETESIAITASRYKNIAHISKQNANIDGGDVLLIDNFFFVGVSSRTNKTGIEEFASILSPFNRYKVIPIEIPYGLHLKSSVTQIAPNKIFITKNLAKHPAFKDYKKITVPEDEEYAANTLLINGTLLMSEGFPKSAKVCKDEGCKVVTLDMSEFRKMDGSLTCLSLRF